MNRVVNLLRGCFGIGGDLDDPEPVQSHDQKTPEERFLEWKDNVDDDIRRIPALSSNLDNLNRRLTNSDLVHGEHLRVQEDHRIMILAMADLIGQDKIAASIRERNKASYSETYVPNDDCKEIPETFRQKPLCQLSNDTMSVPGISGITMPSLKPNNERYYEMDSKKQGKLIFFSHENYIPKFNLTTRECSEEEIKLIKETFKNFEVTVYKDPTKEKIKKVLKQLENGDFQNYNCLIIIVATHGKGGGWIYAKDDEYLDGIFEKTLAKIDSLAGKPKIVLIDTCRGPEIDCATFVRKKTDSIIEKLEDNTDSIDETEDETTDSTNDPLKNIMMEVPSKADILVAYSAAPGYVSWRNRWIPMLCKNLKLNPTEDFFSILTITADEVSQYVGKIEIKGTLYYGKQIPTNQYALRKKIHLHLL